MPLDSEYVQDALRVWTTDEERIQRLNNWFKMVKNGELHRDPFAPRLVELLDVEAVVSQLAFGCSLSALRLLS